MARSSIKRDCAKPERHGRVGQCLTEAILLACEFTVETPIPDEDGTDHRVLLPKKHITEPIRQQIYFESPGRVQSKFFQKGTTLHIPVHYVSENEAPREDFFLFIHSQNSIDGFDYYFFTAENVVEHFRVRKDKYCFSITQKRRFADYLNVGHSRVTKIMVNKLLEWQEIRNEQRKRDYDFGDRSFET